jgi:hypothetical protein
MTSKERMLVALNRGKPDRLPVTVNQWQVYHLEEYLGGISDLDAFQKFGLDAAVQYFQDMGEFWLPNADFIEIDIDAYNPLEAKAGLDAVELRRRYGHKLGMCGNSNIQIWETGDLNLIKKEVLRKFNAANPNEWWANMEEVFHHD